MCLIAWTMDGPAVNWCYNDIHRQGAKGAIPPPPNPTQQSSEVVVLAARVPVGGASRELHCGAFCMYLYHSLLYSWSKYMLLYKSIQIHRIGV